MSTTEPIFLVPQDGDSPPPANPEATVQAPDGEPVQEKAPPTSSLFQFLPFIVIGVIFWMLLIGPERKNRKRQDAMRKELKKGDDVMTTGGMFGRVVAVDEDKVTLQVADNVRVKFVKQAIQGRVGDEATGKPSEVEVKKEG